MIRVDFKANKPGYANVEILKWKGDKQIEVAIQSSQDHKFFDPQGQWDDKPVWLKLDGLKLDNGKLVGVVGPWLVDGLLAQGSNVQYRISVRSFEKAHEDEGVIRFVDNVLASSATGDTTYEDEVRVEPEIAGSAVKNTEIPEKHTVSEAQTSVVEEVVAESAPRKATVVAKKNNKFPLLLGLLILLLGAGGAGWYFLQKPKAPVLSECDFDGKSDELTFLQQCLKTKPDATKVLAVIEKAKSEKVCSLAQRLYANQAQSGNAQVALAYAKEYDPEFAKSNSCFAVDKDAAIYWYETTLSADANNAEAKQRLEQLKNSKELQ